MMARITPEQHSFRDTPEYAAWSNMKYRCNNPRAKQYPDYGGRGIRVCDSWQRSFLAFLADMGPRPSPKHSLDRYPDNDRDYEPGNCRWATASQQNSNRRGNVVIEQDGERLLLKHAAERVGLANATVRRRIRCGMSVSDALSTPLRGASR
jgi:hypothetical protein